MESEYYIETGFGAIKYKLNENGLYSVELPVTRRGDPEMRRSSFAPSELRKGKPGDQGFEEKIRAYFRGEKVDFSKTKLDLSGYTDFEKQVFYTIMKSAGYGATMSYEEVAAAAGYPGAARAAGNALAKNRLLIVVPCHRVVNADGKMGGWSGPEGWKELLLGLEKQG